jgi:hypothetical protein
MVLWFVVLAALGISWIVRVPSILLAINPIYGVELFVREPWSAFVALGSVVLAVTGCEALYADMGHFGKLPIRWAWFGVAFPALVLNYFGQGASLLYAPSNAHAVFYSMAPHWAHYPLVALANRRRHHRFAGGDLGRVLDHPAGSAARPASAHGNSPHQRDRLWPDLRATNEFHPAPGRRAHRPHLQIVGRARHRLWHCRSQGSW